jgi:predicted transcriptional regulator
MAERLDVVARVLWEQDCGIVPIVDSANVLVGVVTDRDVCMAGYTQGRPLGEITIPSVMSRVLRTCRPEDPLATAMAAMQQAQVHRLPVVDARGLIVGILSTNDLVRLANTRPAALDLGTVLKMLATIGAPRRVAAPAAAPTATSTAAAAATIPAPAKPAAVAPKPATAMATAASPPPPAAMPAPAPAAKASAKAKPATKPKGKKN